jgi:hypothetical protein
VHKEAALLVIEMLARCSQLLFPLLGAVQPETVIERLEEDHTSGELLIFDWKGPAEDRRQHESAFLIHAASEFAGEHVVF